MKRSFAIENECERERLKSLVTRLTGAQLNQFIDDRGGVKLTV